MTERIDMPPWGFFALVSYVPDPLGSFFYDLRRTLPGQDNPQAHITILPPRPLLLPVQEASQQALATLERFSGFRVQLSDVRCFPQTKFLYLDIAEGKAVLHEMHDALNTGALMHEEMYEFWPHLTLGGPVPAPDVPEVLAMAESAWKALPCSPRFTLAEVVCLWLGPGEPTTNWRQLWCHRLGAVPQRSRAATAAVTVQTW